MAFVMAEWGPAMAPSTRVHILVSVPKADVGRPLAEVVGMLLVVVWAWLQVKVHRRQRVAPARLARIPGAKNQCEGSNGKDQ
jgi:hypothetical protein